jgi:hypothetical protein
MLLTSSPRRDAPELMHCRRVRRRMRRREDYPRRASRVQIRRSPTTNPYQRGLMESVTAAPQLPPQAVVMQMVMGGWIARTISEVSSRCVPRSVSTARCRFEVHRRIERQCPAYSNTQWHLSRQRELLGIQGKSIPSTRLLQALIWDEYEETCRRSAFAAAPLRRDRLRWWGRLAVNVATRSVAT